jgi:hypothetical protein
VPTLEECQEECSILIDQPAGSESQVTECKTCQILSRAEVDSIQNLEITYDCSNAIRGTCVALNANGDCVSNVVDDTAVTNLTVTADEALFVGTNLNDFTCRFVDDPDSPLYNFWLCAYNEYPYPVASALGSVLLANCTSNVSEAPTGPTPKECQCAIILQLDPTNSNNRQQCSSCSFVPPADESTFQIAYTCDLVRDGISMEPALQPQMKLSRQHPRR